MNVSKKYASMIAQLKKDDSEYFYERIELLNNLLSNDVKFKTFIASKMVSVHEKVKLILDSFKGSTREFENFLFLLASNSGLLLIESIFQELKKERYKSLNVSHGTIYTSIDIDSSTLASIEENLSSRFNVNIKLTNILCKDKVIRVVLDDLGYEISLSSEYVKKQIKEVILKAII